LEQYFLSILADPKEGRERSIIAIYGLASLKEPVLVAANNLLELSDLSVLEKLYLGLAVTELGAHEQGRFVLKSVVDEYGEEYKPGVRLKVGRDQDDILQVTSLAADLAIKLDEYPKDELFSYMLENYTQDILIYFEQLAYVSGGLPKAPSEAVKFSYIIDGKKETKKLEKGETLAIQVNPEQLQSIGFENISGNVGLASYFLVPFEADTVRKDNNISASRSYTVGGAATNSFKEADLIKIDLDYSLGAQSLSGCYQISDYLPSGLKPVIRPYSRVSYSEDENIWYPYEINGQKVSFCVYQNTNKHPAYYARVVSKGEYNAEPVVIQSLQSTDSINLSNPAVVSILQ
jgi:hypothetical protein